MKIRETFEYEVETNNLKEVFTIRDLIDCAGDMTTPFWDGMKFGAGFDRTLEVIKDDQLYSI